MDENFLQIEQIRAREGILHSIWNFLEIPAKDLQKEHGLDQTHLILPPHFMSCWEPIDVDISSCFSWLDVWKKIDEEIGNEGGGLRAVQPTQLLYRRLHGRILIRT